MTNCKHCNIETTNPMFCSHSCAAKTNNIGVRRRGSPKALCQLCGEKCSTAKAKFCSSNCKKQITQQQFNIAHHRLMNALRQSRYRAKKYRVLSEDANTAKIKEIYMNCPEGHEVDHIIPLSLGGLHHEDNLQYLPWRENRRKSNRCIG